MKPLATNRQALTWLCICSFDQNAIRKKTIAIILTLIFFILGICYFVSTIDFFVKNVSIDIKKSLYAVFQLFASASLVFMWIAALISRKGINQILESLDTIHEESKLGYAINFI